MEVDDSELESVDEAEEISALPAGGMSVEEQMRLLESGGVPTPPPPGGGMSLEEQMRQMEGGGTPPADGMSLEEQMRQMEAQAGGGMGSPPPADVPDYAPGDDVGFEEHLRNLVMELRGGIAGSISGYDGIGIAAFSNDPDFDQVIADAEMASVMGAIRKAAESLQAGNPAEAYFLSGRFGFIIKAIGTQYFVTIILEASELNWGLTRLQVNKIVPFIERELF